MAVRSPKGEQARKAINDLAATLHPPSPPRRRMPSLRPFYKSTMPLSG
jgi:hypothetical protein